MEMHKIREMLTDSTSDAWHTITCWGAGSGPAYHYGWVETSEGLRPEPHGMVAIFQPDVRLTIAWGAEQDPEDGDHTRRRTFDWNHFTSDDPVVGLWVDVFWGGELVDRRLMYAVDGARGLIPFPDRTLHPEDGPADNRVSRFAYEFGFLVHSFEHHPEDYDRYLETAGFTVVG